MRIGNKIIKVRNQIAATPNSKKFSSSVIGEFNPIFHSQKEGEQYFKKKAVGYGGNAEQRVYRVFDRKSANKTIVI